MCCRIGVQLRSRGILAAVCCVLLTAACTGHSAPSTTATPPTHGTAPRTSSSAPPTKGSTDTLPAASYRAVSAARTGTSRVYLVASGACHRRRRCTRVYRSDDAGRHWLAVATPPGDLDLAMITASGPRIAWITETTPQDAPGPTWVTTDAGAHWRALGVSATAVTVASGSVYAAAGANLYAGPLHRGHVHRIGKAAGDSLFALGGVVYNYASAPARTARSHLLAVDGGGVHHENLPCGQRVSFADALTGTASGNLLAVCGSQPAEGAQIKSSFLSPDGGHTWQRTGNPPYPGYIGIGARGSAGSFLVGGRMSLIGSFDSGRTWRVVVEGSGSAGGFRQVGFNGGQYGWAVDGGPPSRLYVSADGGRSWRAAARP